MRDLIKPTLFMVARLGLLLAVVAWIAGQWWTAELHSTACRFVAMDNGYTIGIWRTPAYVPGILNVHRRDGVRDYWPLRRKFILKPTAWQSAIPGIVRAGGHSKWDSMSFLIGVRHWLIVTNFTIINICLHWFYRKRPEVQPCGN